MNSRNSVCKSKGSEEKTLAERSGEYMVVLDTSIVIDYLKGEKEVVEVIEKFSKAKFSITFITEYELLKYRGGTVKKAFNDILTRFVIYHSDDKSAVIAAEIYNKLEDKGELINENDILIAGISLSKNDALLTRDKDFEKIGHKSIIVIK
ncbi:PilT protein domain protein [mine drainage metagenome]|uniref:PilT protein domain protein n=1 Tax=mine drainage metagenome TaxID=410659 RepID=T1AW63_9ZZZZ